METMATVGKERSCKYGGRHVNFSFVATLLVRIVLHLRGHHLVPETPTSKRGAMLRLAAGPLANAYASFPSLTLPSLASTMWVLAIMQQYGHSNMKMKLKYNGMYHQCKIVPTYVY